MSRKILLADDSVTIRKVVELTFMDEDYDLVAVASGDEALSTLSSSTDLVITDVHMPGTDGYEVCETVKERFPDKPVLLLVGTFEAFDEERAEEVGADDFLKKPFDSQELLGKVRNLVAAPAAAASPTPELTPIESPLAVAAPAGDDGGTADFEPEDMPETPAAADMVAEPASEPSPERAEVAADSASQVASPATAEAPLELSDETVDRIARRVVELLSEESIRDVAWEVIPDLAEVVIKERLAELEAYDE